MIANYYTQAMWAYLTVDAHAWWLAGPAVFLLLAVFSTDKDHEEWRMALSLAAVAAVFIGPASAWWLPQLAAALHDAWTAAGGRLSPAVPPRAWSGLPLLAASTATGGVGGGLWWLLYRHLPARAEAARERWTRRSRAARDSRTDIRSVAERLPKADRSFDPRQYFQPGKIVFGLDEYRKPVSVPYDVFRRSHLQLIGTTGAGKGVAAGLMISQALAQGEAVIVMDPKDDEWAPFLARQEAERAGVPFVLIDLRQEAEQFNMIQGASPAQVEELLVAGLSLSDRGDAADFYRVRDRRAARELATRVMAGNPAATLVDLYEAGEADKKITETAEGLMAKLGEIVTVGTVNGLQGPDLGQLIEAGACIYVLGSMRNGRILSTQRMLLVRLMQIVESRDRLKGPPRQVLIFLDEFVAFLSRPAKEMLGAIRDKGAHLILAHQSVEDVKDCPSDINPEAMAGAVIENTSIRVAYRVKSADTAKWLAETTGKILIDDETRKIDRNGALVESATGERSVKIAEKDRLDINIFLGLPDSVAVIFAPNLVEPAHIHRLDVKKLPLSFVQAQPRPPQIVPPPPKPKQRTTKTTPAPQGPTASPPAPPATAQQELPDVDL